MNLFKKEEEMEVVGGERGGGWGCGVGVGGGGGEGVGQV